MTINEITNPSRSKTAAPDAKTRCIQVWLAADGSETHAQGMDAAIAYVKALPTPVGVKQVIGVAQSKVFAPATGSDAVEDTAFA